MVVHKFETKTPREAKYRQKQHRIIMESNMTLGRVSNKSTRCSYTATGNSFMRYWPHGSPSPSTHKFRRTNGITQFGGRGEGSGDLLPRSGSYTSHRRPCQPAIHHQNRTTDKNTETNTSQKTHRSNSSSSTNETA